MTSSESALAALKKRADAFYAAAARGASTWAEKQQLQSAIESYIESKGASAGGSGQGGNVTNLKSLLEGNESFRQLKSTGRGPARIRIEGAAADELLSRKDYLSNSGAGYQATGVLPIDRVSGITPEPRQQLYLADLLPKRTTDRALIDFVRVATPMSAAQPQIEMSPKFESEPTLTSVSEKVQTIAIFSVASRQILEDLGDLAMFLQTSQKYYLDLAVELQLLAGDGVDPQLNGLIPQAASFNTGLLVGSAGYNRIDIVGRAIQQIQRSKEIAPSWVVLNPDDWWSARLQKDSLGRYILGDPSQTAEAQLFDLTVLSTVNITPGTFLLGNSSPIASELRIRSEVTYEIATQNEDQFVKNLITARSECRLALITKRPGSFVTGTFVTSPSM